MQLIPFWIVNKQGLINLKKEIEQTYNIKLTFYNDFLDFPINQWLIFDFFEIVENLGKNVNRQLKNSRYDDQIAIFGNEIQKKIEETNIFLIGAGALGCEYLKIFALMGILLQKEKK